MTPCDRLEDAVAEGRELSLDLRRHASECDRCRALTATDDALSIVVNGESDAREGELPAALREAMRAEPHATPYSFASRAAAPSLVAVTIVAMAFSLAPRADLSHRALAPYVSGAVTLVALVFGGVTAALHRGARGLGLTVSQRAGYLVVALLAAELAVAGASAPVEGSIVPRGASATYAMLHCASWGSMVAVGAGAILFFVARRTIVTGAAVAGAVAGVAAGLTGTLALHVVCSVVTLPHTMIAHVAPAFLGAIVGALFGRRVLEA